MDISTANLIEHLWALPKHPEARLALVQTQPAEVRNFLAESVRLSVDEFVAYAARNLSTEQLGKIKLGTTYRLMLTSAEDVRTLVQADRIDRRARRVVLDELCQFSLFTADELQQMAGDLPVGDGLDDYVIEVLPRWVSEEYQFDAEALLPRLGALAAARLLAGTGPDQLSDERVLELLQNPLERWKHPEPGRAWHHRSHVRDALTILFTHRPGLAAEASQDMELVPYVLSTPHWEPSFAGNLRGLDFGTRTITPEVDGNTPGMLLSLIWHPRTPLTQAEAIREIAEQGMDANPQSKDWKIAASASETRISAQPWHIRDYSDELTAPDQIERLRKRLKSGIVSSFKHEEKTLNGMRPETSDFWWPKRYGEALALLGSTSGTRVVNEAVGSGLLQRATYTVPVGTWSWDQLKLDKRLASDILPPPTLQSEEQGAESAPLLPDFTAAANHVARAMSILPDADTVPAWDLFLEMFDQENEARNAKWVWSETPRRNEILWEAAEAALGTTLAAFA